MLLLKDSIAVVIFVQLSRVNQYSGLALPARDARHRKTGLIQISLEILRLWQKKKKIGFIPIDKFRYRPSIFLKIEK